METMAKSEFEKKLIAFFPKHSPVSLSSRHNFKTPLATAGFTEQTQRKFLRTEKQYFIGFFFLNKSETKTCHGQ